MGDFNFPQIDWHSWNTPCKNPEENGNLIIEAVRDSYLHQHINKPTRARRNHTSHILDLVFTNEEGMVSGVEHHSPIGKVIIHPSTLTSTAT